MHETLHAEVKGHLDIDGTQPQGWCFGPEDAPIPIRAISDDGSVFAAIVESRPDVARFYEKESLTKCGFKIPLPFPMEVRIQAELKGEWHDVFNLRYPVSLATLNTSVNKKALPSYMVVDNFYENPDAIRQFALSLKYQFHPGYHKGQRTDGTYQFPELKARFEQLLGVKIDEWKRYGTNACFQFCVDGNELVYHIDNQMYAAVIYLTPDAPPDCGTSLFRSKKNKRMKPADPPSVYAETFANGFLDRSQFDLVDTVGNVYNRCILFDAQVIHAASKYFGDSKYNGRLFQLFFFDIVKE